MIIKKDYEFKKIPFSHDRHHPVRLAFERLGYFKC